MIVRTRPATARTAKGAVAHLATKAMTAPAATPGRPVILALALALALVPVPVPALVRAPVLVLVLILAPALALVRTAPRQATAAIGPRACR